jgi:hypothetical protein
MDTKFYSEYMKQKDQLRDLGASGSIILKRILKEKDVAMWTILPVTVAVRSEAWVLAGWLLGSWVRIPLKAWMFVPCLSALWLSCVGRGLSTG